MNFVLLVLMLLLPRTVGAEDPTMPDPPAGQVLDQSGWLPDNTSGPLESELGRLRRDHQVDVQVVIWDQPLPGDHDPHSFARHLGSTWARENLWAVVLQEPGSDTPPAVAYQGPSLEQLGPETVIPAIQAAIDRGLKDWSDRERTSAVALNLAEELVHLRLRQQHTEAPSQLPVAAPAGRQQENARAIRISLGVVAAILLIGVFITFRLVRRRGPAKLLFPDTRWRLRLGASWCGGTDLVTTFTPTEPQ